MAEIHLPLTQLTEQSSSIFVDPSGYPLSVYLDVNPEILSRPRLIRLLRVRIVVISCLFACPECLTLLQTSGADICHNPSAASILLINSDTESGRKFVHDWSADSHKIVLNYGWIQACIRMGRPLLDGDEWGGFHVPHTSECMYSEDENDEGMEDEHNGSRWVSFRPIYKYPAHASTHSC
jgi:hypothetical protein